MPHYRIKKFTAKDRNTWSVEDTRTGRIVAVYVDETAALLLAHTLNVADLSSSIVAFDADP